MHKIVIPAAPAVDEGFAGILHLLTSMARSLRPYGAHLCLRCTHAQAYRILDFSRFLDDLAADED